MESDQVKIRIEIDENIVEEEIVIKCNSLSSKVKIIQSALSGLLTEKTQIDFYKKDQEFYIVLEDVLYFESDLKGISAHTADDRYQVKYKLYELEEILPRSFIRISKSSIVNTEHIYSILRNIASASKVEFRNSSKVLYVSRHYYKQLKLRLTEARK
jgi:DNA-binding LytR/AlgR family response regulator